MRSMGRVLELGRVPFMHWGIVSRYNWSIKLAPLLPRKRWDPLASYVVRPGLRAGYYSYISPVRGSRPSSSKPRDILGSLSRGEDYAVFVTLDTHRVSDPLDLSEPVMMECRGYEAITIINRFPAMVRCLDPEVEEEVLRAVEDEYTKLARGVALISFPTSYAESFVDAGWRNTRAILRSMIEALRYTVESAVRDDYQLIPIYPFFNVGRMAGASQPRLHAQAYVDLNQDGYGAIMDATLKTFASMKGGCHLCESEHEGRVLVEEGRWIAWLSLSPRRNLHVRMALKRHLPDITGLDERDLESLARVLVDTWRALDAVGVAPDRHVVFYTRPHGLDAEFHVFIDILPFEMLGGIEVLDSCRVARYEPRQVARKLREALQSLEPLNSNSYRLRRLGA